MRGLSPGLFTQLYVRLIRPRLDGLTETEPSAPPRFAQLLGFVFLGIATVLFTAGATTAGWIVTVLATLAATTRRICVGCIIYDRATT